ncbi:MAG: tetratricopeptide repeat protein, partial [Phycisphaerales bacterium]|nr:tetratricopeptide repeat protein [Phycisphaerales bacterium]
RGLGSWDEAIAEAHLAQEIHVRELGADSREAIESVLLECNILVDADRTPEVALDLAQRALRQATSALGDRHDTTIGARGIVAKGLMRLDRYADAAEVLAEVIATQVSISGPGSIPAATNRANLAICLQKLGRLEDAEAEYVEALRAFDASGTEKLTEALTLRDHYADLLADTGRLDEAEVMKREVLAISREIYGEDNVNVYRVMNNLATTLAQAGKNQEEQRTLLTEVLEFFRARYGERHQGTLQARNNLGAFLLQNDDPAGAEEVFRRVADVMIDMHGRSSVRTFTARQNLGRALLMLERYEDSEATYAAVVEDAAAALPASHWLLAGFRMNHAR